MLHCSDVARIWGKHQLSEAADLLFFSTLATEPRNKIMVVIKNKYDDACLSMCPKRMHQIC